MQFQFAFRHMESSPALQGYAEEKLREKIQQFVTKAIEAHVTFSVVRHSHTAHLSFKGGDGFSLDVEHTSGDMYASIDQLVDKLTVQLKRHKEKLKDHKQVKATPELVAVVGEARTPTVAAAEVVDAGDIVKFEAARKRANSGH
jgi:putative sigma-54 modulation protein